MSNTESVQVVSGPFSDGWGGVYFLVIEGDGTEQVQYQEEVK